MEEEDEEGDEEEDEKYQNMRKSKTEEVDYEARTMKRKEKLCDYSTVLKEGRGAGNSLCLFQTRERTYLPNSLCFSNRP